MTMKTIYSSNTSRKADAPKRRPRLRRDERSQPGWRLTPRDKAILLTLADYRMLSTPQLEELLFAPEPGQDHPTKTSRAQLRLRLLFHAGFVSREEIPTRL